MAAANKKKWIVLVFLQEALQTSLFPSSDFFLLPASKTQTEEAQNGPYTWLKLLLTETNFLQITERRGGMKRSTALRVRTVNKESLKIDKSIPQAFWITPNSAAILFTGQTKSCLPAKPTCSKGILPAQQTRHPEPYHSTAQTQWQDCKKRRRNKSIHIEKAQASLPKRSPGHLSKNTWRALTHTQDKTVITRGEAKLCGTAEKNPSGEKATPFLHIWCYMAEVI